MDRKGKLFDDLAGMAGGAFSMIAGLRAEMEAMARAQSEAMITRLDLAKREDLDAAMELARRAREDAEALSIRVAALEAKLAEAEAKAEAGGEPKKSETGKNGKSAKAATSGDSENGKSDSGDKSEAAGPDQPKA